MTGTKTRQTPIYPLHTQLIKNKKTKNKHQQRNSQEGCRGWGKGCSGVGLEVGVENYFEVTHSCFLKYRKKQSRKQGEDRGCQVHLLFTPFLPLRSFLYCSLSLVMRPWSTSQACLSFSTQGQDTAEWQQVQSAVYAFKKWSGISYTLRKRNRRSDALTEPEFN